MPCPLKKEDDQDSMEDDVWGTQSDEEHLSSLILDHGMGDQPKMQRDCPDQPHTGGQVGAIPAPLPGTVPD